MCTQIRLLKIRIYTICHFVCIFDTMVKPNCSIFRIITRLFLNKNKPQHEQQLGMVCHGLLGALKHNFCNDFFFFLFRLTSDKDSQTVTSAPLFPFHITLIYKQESGLLTNRAWASSSTWNILVWKKRGLTLKETPSLI